LIHIKMTFRNLSRLADAYLAFGRMLVSECMATGNRALKYRPRKEVFSVC
jgi:hypothetical protein